MNGQNQTGQTAPASPGSSNQGTTPSTTTNAPESSTSVVNPFERSPTPEPMGNEVTGTQPAETSMSSPAEQTPTAPTAAPAVSLTADDLRKSIIDGIVTAQRQGQQMTPTPPPQEPKGMTPEEFRAHYGIPAVDEQTYTAIFGVSPDNPARVQALDQLMQGYMRAGLKMGQDLFKAQLAQVQDQFSTQLTPLQQAYAAQQEANLLNEFVAANRDLANDMAMVNEVRDAMIARGVKFPSKDVMFKEVGAATRQLIARIRGQQAAGGQSQQPSSSPTGGAPKAPTRQMTPASAGGRGGSAASNRQPSTAEQVFGG